ncbi:anthranilate synthase family protein [Micromonospora sp. SCSIO 07396]
MSDDLLSPILAGTAPAFALLHRPETTGSGVLEVLTGTPEQPATLAELPLPDGPGHQVLALVPYRQIAERGFAAPDDGAPLIALRIIGRAVLPVADVLNRLPADQVRLDGGGFDVEDEEYARLVRRLIDDEIGTGRGANFVLRRTFVTDITDYRLAHALALFRRLMRGETGAYWTFLVHTGERTFVGASPERHVSLRNGTAVMNPISGTYRYPASGPTLPGVMDFLADRKEIDELYMVVDEELKMMARICAEGGRVRGPYLKQMARLAHTEYLIEGSTDRDPRDILRETLFAPTVTGSPLESAAAVIARYELGGRGYYSGVLAVIGRDDTSRVWMDSAIMIRTADIDARGHLRIGVGATLVRHSDPYSEVAETRAKAAGLLAALQAGPVGDLAEHPDVRAALRDRNTGLADFWLAAHHERSHHNPRLAGRRVLVVDAEDTFTSMIDHQLRSLGMDVAVVNYDDPYAFGRYDLVVMGPGPGDPRDAADPKIAQLRAAIGRLLAEDRPFLAVCLSHQVLSTLLGLPLRRRDVPNQGVQRRIDFFGRDEVVGFYNTFAAHSSTDVLESAEAGTVRISRDAHSEEVHGLSGPRFRSMQFHAESVLTRDGVRLIAGLIIDLIATPVPAPR